MSNVGSVDRLLRIVFGIAILSLAFVGPETPWGYLGIILILTGVSKFCPAYRLLGICTNKRTT